VAQRASQVQKNVALLMQLQRRWAWYQLFKVVRSAEGALSSAGRVVSSGVAAAEDQGRVAVVKATHTLLN